MLPRLRKQTAINKGFEFGSHLRRAPPSLFKMPKMLEIVALSPDSSITLAVCALSLPSLPWFDAVQENPALASL